MYKVSDFHIATTIIKTACRSVDKPFIDLTVVFDDDDKQGYFAGKIYLGNPKVLGQTLTRLVFEYLNNFENICGTGVFVDDEQRKKTFISIANFFRAISFSQDSYLEAKSTEPVVKRLYQMPFLWILLRDIISPAYGLAFDNCQVVIASSPFVDVATVVCPEDIEDREIEESFVFVNNDIEYKPYAWAQLFVQLLNKHDKGLEILQDIFNTTVCDKVVGAADLYFNTDQEVNDFIIFLLTFLDDDNNITDIIKRFYKKANADDSLKFAQYSGQESGRWDSSNWHFLGLIEKMLEPARGPDLEVHQQLEELHSEIWNKVEEERKKRGLDGVPYETLLRIHSGERDDSGGVAILEKELLSSDRVW